MTRPGDSRLALKSNLLIALAGGACFLVSAAVTLWLTEMQDDRRLLMLWIVGIPLLLRWVMLLRRTLLLSITVTASSIRLRYWARDCSLGLSELQGVILYRPAGTSGTGLVLDLADGSRVGIPAGEAETRRILQLLRLRLPGLPAQRRSRTFAQAVVRNAVG